MTRENEYYDDLAQWAENLDPDTTVFGEVSDKDHQELVEAILASDDPDMKAAVKASGGRPTLDPKETGPSPLWTLRAPASLDAQMREIADKKGLSFSELVRLAATEYVNKHTTAA